MNMTAQILDVSKYDGREILTTNPYTYAYHPIDWGQAKAEWAGGIVKASQGMTVDPLYVKQVEAMRVAGAPDGAYHFYQTSVNAISAAQAFCNLLETSGGYGDLGVWLDVESNPTNLSGSTFLAGVGSWLNEAAKRMMSYGSPAPLGIYTRASFIDPLWVAAGQPTWTATIPAWLAMYSYDRAADFEQRYQAVMSGAVSPPVPASQALRKLYCHQWTARGKPGDVPGYPPYKLSVDFNLWSAPWPVVTPELPLTVEERLARLEVHDVDHERRIRSLEQIAGIG